MSDTSEHRNYGLPDNTFPEGLCPRCGKQAAFSRGALWPLVDDGTTVVAKDGSRMAVDVERASILTCQNCNRGLVVIERRFQGPRTMLVGGTPIAWRGVHWWPSVGATVHKAVPDSIRRALEEAETTLSIGCYRSATIMARHALEAVTKEQGATKYSLIDRLKEMAAAGKLQPTLSEWANEVRLVGNVGAHDPLAEVPEDDAKDLIAFMQALANYLYVLPFELAERRKKKSSAP